MVLRFYGKDAMAVNWESEFTALDRSVGASDLWEQLQTDPHTHDSTLVIEYLLYSATDFP